MTQKEYEAVCEIVSRQLKLIKITPTYRKVVIDTIGVEKIKRDLFELLDDNFRKDSFIKQILEEKESEE